MGREGALSHPLLAWWPLGPAGRLALSGDWAELAGGPGKGGQWALVFAEISPSKTLQPLDKHDHSSSGLQHEGQKQAWSWTHPSHFTDWKTKSPREWKEDKRALKPGSRAT